MAVIGENACTVCCLYCVLSVFGSIFYLTQMVRCLSPGSAHLELSDAGLVLPHCLAGGHHGDITHHPLTGHQGLMSDVWSVCCGLCRHFTRTVGLALSVPSLSPYLVA